jgi:hypothetical protein
MLAKGTGVRQFATRSALYSDAKEARSADVVPGMPLGSDAPGAPGVEPPMAAGHTGAAGGVGVGVGVGASLTATGVFEMVRLLTFALAAVVVTEWSLGATAPDEVDCVCGCPEPADAVDWSAVATAAIADVELVAVDNAEVELLAAIVTPPACEMDGSDEPDP